VRLWHATIGMTPGQAVKERLDGWMSGRKFFSVFALDEATLRRYVDFVRRRRPALLDGYAEAFNVVASLLASKEIDGLQAGAIISSAQTLPPETRALVERQFGCRVFDKYGAREFSGIAHECEAHAGYHVNAESYLVEVVRDGRPAAPGEVGEVVITDLNNYCMPFIRYRIGDLAVAMDDRVACACGRGLPMIEVVIGRRRLPDQWALRARHVLRAFFKEYEHAARYQIQEAKTPVVRLCASPASRPTRANLRQRLAALEDMHVELECVDAVALGRTGKAQAVICRIPLPLFSADAARVWEEEDARRGARD
jgi:phenylacetate-CoA ligase